MYICAKGENFGFAKEIGVGLIDSSIELTALIMKEMPNELIFIGSAGSYSNDIKLLDIFVSYSATQIESSFVSNASYTPIDNKIEIVSHETDNIASLNITKLLDSKKAIVNSSNYISTDEEYAKKLSRSGILLENMEFFAILKVANYFRIPTIGIFCITNYCNKNAHNDFLQNQPLAKEKLINFIKKLK